MCREQGQFYWCMLRRRSERLIRSEVDMETAREYDELRDNSEQIHCSSRFLYSCGVERGAVSDERCGGLCISVCCVHVDIINGMRMYHSEWIKRVYDILQASPAVHHQRERTTSLAAAAPAPLCPLAFVLWCWSAMSAQVCECRLRFQNRVSAPGPIGSESALTCLRHASLQFTHSKAPRSTLLPYETSSAPFGPRPLGWRFQRPRGHVASTHRARLSPHLATSRHSMTRPSHASHSSCCRHV